ncbi:hypothetical protein FNF29_08150 [Cafeteria roenbergensis]|uniref:Ferrochelatase n=1 Tax=Cafeteria roenbergensis TaxID=33653 RepID=A0A5A8C146_CAFRO|nr:hypothetical protein FNF29_08150 [Cafeteria roenbergensis]KAA0159017.1 hypothetical protein FNF31_05080 [Cafeteria roenbergensis]|eukprot:KAA0146279.1 hypothetical protein FNF29_08150 [Cafeteria roenbergensis]
MSSTATRAGGDDAPTGTPKTGVLMLNMGGPSSLEGERDGVGAFLRRLFEDGEIITLGRLQNSLGSFIARRRTPKIIEQYRQIGGKSPIGDWTRQQGRDMERKLDALSPSTGPHRAYVGFRYAPPLTEDALDAMAADGVERVVAFSQYPQFSCTTAGSSYNHLWRTLRERGLEGRFKFSVLDRWSTNRTYIEAVADQVRQGLQALPDDPALRSRAVLVFTAHSLPMKVVYKGDQYPAEVTATVGAVMALVRQRAAEWGVPVPRHVLAWQSKVGYLPWMGPSTGQVLEGLGRQGHEAVVMTPLGFTSDHIETLFEIDVEYREDAEKAGIRHFGRAPSLNASDLVTTAMAEVVADHLASGEVCTPQYQINCHACDNATCRTVLDPIAPYAKLRDSYGKPSPVPTWPEGSTPEPSLQAPAPFTNTGPERR